MALTNPIYNLEENLDIYLLSPFNNLKNIKGHIEAIIEDDFLEDISTMEQQWIEFLDLSSNIIDTNLEVFYVINLLKKLTYSRPTEGNETQEIVLPIGSKLLIPQSYIDIEKTTNMQLEPNMYVLDFNFDYLNETFTDPDDLIEQVKEFVSTRSKEAISVSSRKVDLYKEEDLNSILRLLKVYYMIDLPLDLIDKSESKKPNTIYGEYNRDSIRNVLCSAINTQVVLSSTVIGDKVSINRKIEVSLLANESRKIQCTIYNRTKSEIKTFKY